MDQMKAPVYEALQARRLKGESSFHVPGHKFGHGLGEAGCEHYRRIMELDYTEIDGLDDLHHPVGIIEEAQNLASACFGSEESMFLVGGSTVGNLAMLMTVCSRGDLILVQRNAHKSVIHGLMLAGARVVFLSPVIHEQSGIAGCVAWRTLAAALAQYPEAKGVFLTNPNYYGMGRDLGPHAELVHRYGIPLLVDEAHGAHLGFHPDLPPSALSRGADAVVQSTHKMLTAMTMGAMLHVQGTRIDRRRLKERLAMLQSSSPSYPLMASLDLARRRIATEGERLLAEVLEHLRTFQADYSERASGNPLQFVPPSPPSPAFDYMDPFKLIVYDATGRLSGFRLLEELADEGVVAEMADDRHTVLACSLATSRQDLARLNQAMLRMEAGPRGDYCPTGPAMLQGYAPPEEIGVPILMGLDESEERERIAVPLYESVGRICAQSVIPYPPGIPLLFPGEQIRLSVIEYIDKLMKTGARFQGALQEGADCSIIVMKVK
ncbi:MAG: lysine decarboxylase-like protein [Paenibacillaceae bacterium]|jgi:arginine/lysine/ornithine decarboxylase|nr:lysine decarboxylase-like protein [Paenibacillaceae bacterium]